ncbi:hypothetical protein scyTo_0008092 [Scyliorhinus torazame]|uniref:Uncharacterized protein n=1 Tax=Scyliorhinus torazame TaxID=75743 RepID=A0A401P3D4_SCYTO|nr:hypothetical protein [Scyliorhinus torazame]
MEQWLEYLDEKFAQHCKEYAEDMTQAIASIKQVAVWVEEKMTTQGQEIQKLQKQVTEREKESTAMALEISILQDSHKRLLETGLAGKISESSGCQRERTGRMRICWSHWYPKNEHGTFPNLSDE